MSAAGPLVGRVALITGAGQGVGLGIARALAARGATVALAGRTGAKVVAAARALGDTGAQAAGFACDVTDDAQVAALVEEVVERFGSLSILVNNAQTTINGRLLDGADADYAAVMDSGPRATWQLMRMCHPHLRGGGAIVNLGSAAGVRGNPSGYGVYAAAKEAVRALTRTAACEWAGDGIRVNAVLPLSTSPALEEWAAGRPEEAAAYLSTVPMGRFGDPERDIGAAVAFLCSDEAGYITGHSLPVDGGQVLMR